MNVRKRRFTSKLRLLTAALVVSGLAFSVSTQAADAATAATPQGGAIKSAGAMKQEIMLKRVTPEYWRITFHNPPFNTYGPETMPQLNEIVTAIETDQNVKVVVFDSDVPNFFLTHYDFVPPLTDTTSMPNGSTGLPQLPDMLVRLSKAPVVSIVSVRGRATGVGSELSLASDLRFATREKAIFSQWEVGAALVPGGGPSSRLPRLMGRGRALEVLLTGEDIDGDLAERYGYVNRSLSDAQLDKFVDTMARRIATFDKQTIADIKKLVNKSGLPENEDIAAEWEGFINSVNVLRRRRKSGN